MSTENKLKAFTTYSDVIKNQLINDVTIMNGEKSITVKAQWDTGANKTCISAAVVKDLALTRTGTMVIKTPSGSDIVNTYLVDINLPNDVVITDVMVCDSEIAKQGFDLLIGMDIINRGDFTVTNHKGKTVFSFIMPSQKVIDYAMQLDIKNITGKHGKGKRTKK